MPLVATRGAASAQGFGEFAVTSTPTYIEDVFSTYLYTGNSSTQTITNGIDLSGEGGLVWWKNRTNATGHGLIDTTRGIDYYLSSNTTDAQDGPVSYISSVSSTGYSIGVGTQFVNQSANNYVSWTFRKQPKFFDVVTYTGNGTNGRTVAHSLGSTPGCIIVKRTDAANGWAVYHRAMNASPQDYMMRLNATNAAFTTSPSRWNNTLPTSTEFTLSGNDEVNGSGATYVAYLFAHDAGGFGLTGTDNVISCGSYTTNGAGVGSATLGWEPQWLLIKNASGTGNWIIIDNMRGFLAPGGANSASLAPNTSASEQTVGIGVNATGFTDPGVIVASGTVIYIAIRRGPMKVPTTGTSVFSPTVGTDATNLSSGFPVDMFFDAVRTGNADNTVIGTRLIGTSGALVTSKTAAEASGYINAACFQSNTTYRPSIFGSANGLQYSLGRAPGFMDVVCYTGTGVANTAFTHNLTVTPELMIVKPRSAATAPNWRVWSPINSTDFNLLQLSTDGAASSSLYSSSNVFPAIPTATTFTVGGSGSIQLNQSGQTFVAYLFATCAGVSKVFSYTGNGSSQTINCGFTAGSRWVMIKRTDSTGDWYVWDSARGIVAGNDPHLSLNTTAAEVTTDDSVDTDNTGFIVNQVAATNVNVSSATYIGIAIA